MDDDFPRILTGPEFRRRLPGLASSPMPEDQKRRIKDQPRRMPKIFFGEAFGRWWSSYTAWFAARDAAESAAWGAAWRAAWRRAGGSAARSAAESTAWDAAEAEARGHKYRTTADDNEPSYRAVYLDRPIVHALDLPVCRERPQGGRIKDPLAVKLRGSPGNLMDTVYKHLPEVWARMPLEKRCAHLYKKALRGAIVVSKKRRVTPSIERRRS